ncbi:MAG TPA: hypothetical protein PKM65_19325 [Spirochaetota bacterium]|nr:hypothetical protein [Spirochaetota bacterium]HNT11339.1 hypothetical protein [Spirochaetota bacterium]
MKQTAHIRDAELLDLIDGAIPAARSRAMRTHAADCPRCHARLAAAETLLAASDNAALAPSDAVLRRVRASYRRRAGAPRRLDRVRDFARERRSLAIASALAAALILLATTTLMVRQGENGGQVTMDISYIEGDVYINNAEADLTSKIKPNSRIRVGKDSLIEFSNTSAYIIKAIDDSVLVFERAKTPGVRGRRAYTIRLIRGTILSQMRKNTLGLEYSYSTPEAYLRPLEGEFILQSAGDRTVVIMKSGSMRIKSLSSDERVTAEPNKKYTITKSIDRGDAEDDDLDDFNINDAIHRQDGQREPADASTGTVNG